MYTHLVLGTVLVSSSLASLLEPTPSTSDATITPGPQIELLRKQNDNRYMGWVSNSGSWSSRQCDVGGTYYQTDSFWRCCATTRDGCASTAIPVGCISGSLIYPVAATSVLSGSFRPATLTTRACTSVFPDPEDASFTICNTVFMYEGSKAEGSARTNVNCGVSSKNWSYYRVQPDEAKTTASSRASGASTPVSTPATSTPTSPTSPTPTPTSQPEESKAWIAGAVVGPVVGIALIAFGAWFFLRRKKQNQVGSVPGTGATPAGEAKQPFMQDPNAPPNYYPQMGHNDVAPAGVAPFGVSKHDSWAPQGAQGSPVPHAQDSYGAPAQPQWAQQGGSPVNQPVYPAPATSPHPQSAQPYSDDPTTFKHNADTRAFSSELEGSVAQPFAQPHPVPADQIQYNQQPKP